MRRDTRVCVGSHIGLRAFLLVLLISTIVAGRSASAQHLTPSAMRDAPAISGPSALVGAARPIVPTGAEETGPAESNPLSTGDAPKDHDPRATTTPGWNTYSSPVYAVSFRYPAHWQPVDRGSSTQFGERRFEGDDGFFLVSASLDAESDAGLTIDDLTAILADDMSRVHGWKVVIEAWQVQGQDARLVLPPSSATSGAGTQAALLVQYPGPVAIAGRTLRFFVLAADVDHIRTLAQTLRFSAQSVPESAHTPAGLPGTTRTPEPTPAPAVVDVGNSASQPEILRFEVAPDDRLEIGDMVTVRWSVRNQLHTGLCFRYGTRGPRSLREQGGGCFSHLPGEGSQSFTLSPYANGETYYAHFWLDVAGGIPDPDDPNVLHDPTHAQVDVYVPVACGYRWFTEESPRWCPKDPPRSVGAMAQTFQNGIMVYVPNREGTPPHAVTVYYYDAARGANRYRLFMNAPAQPPDANLVTPNGVLVPDPMFYSVWSGAADSATRRGAQALRDVMGWATGDPVSFVRITQCEEGPGTPDSCYVSMPHGMVYEVRTPEHTWTLWESGSHDTAKAAIDAESRLPPCDLSPLQVPIVIPWAPTRGMLCLEKRDPLTGDVARMLEYHASAGSFVPGDEVTFSWRARGGDVVLLEIYDSDAIEQARHTGAEWVPILALHDYLPTSGSCILALPKGIRGGARIVLWVASRGPAGSSVVRHRRLAYAVLDIPRRDTHAGLWASPSP